MDRVQALRESIDRHPLESRLLSAAIGLPVVAGAIWLGSFWLSALIALAAGIGAWELCRMAGLKGRSPATGVAVGWSLILVAFAHVMATEFGGDLGRRSLVVLAVLAYLIWQVRRVRGRLSGGDWAITAGAALYTGGLLAHAVLLRGLDDGRLWLLFAVLVTFATDTTAYGAGRLIGKTRLAPTISPGKTWEGAVSGLLGAIVAALLVVTVFNVEITVLQAAALGVVLGMASQLGDLLESWVKRVASVKDSGWIIPGHGGVMDRLDSIVPNLAVMYYFVIGVVQ